MIKKLSLITLSMLFITTAVYTQSIKSYVITSAGTSLMNSEGTLYLSIGEPMNTEIEGTDIMLSQGFLNISVQELSTASDNLLSEQIEVYPNPTSAELEIKLPEFSGLYKYEMMNPLGQNIRTGLLDNQKNILRLQDLESGTYFLKVIKDDLQSRTLKIVKL